MLILVLCTILFIIFITIISQKHIREYKLFYNILYMSILLLYISVFIIFICIISQKSIKKYHKPTEPDFIKIKTYLEPNYNLNTIKIITYNIQKFPWSLKTVNEIKQLLEQHDIILLQECYSICCFSLQKNLPSYYIYTDTLNGLKLLNSGMVILSKFPIIDAFSIKFKNYNILTLDSLSSKGFIVAPILINNNIIYFINTHLQSTTYKGYDMNAVLQLYEIISYLKKNKLNFILGGDFNIDINDMKALLDDNQYKCYYPNKPTIYINYINGHTQSHNAFNYEGCVFDYFITNISECNIDAKIIHNKYSDHNAVSAIISFT